MKKRNAFTLIELLVVIAIIGTIIVIGPVICLGILFFLTFGWIWGFYHLFHGLEHEAIAVLCGLVAFLLLPVTLHFFVAPIAKRHNKIWTFHKSCLTSFIIVAFAGAGLAIISGFHEVVWLLHPKESLIEIPNGATYRMRSNNNLKQLSIAVQNYSETYEQQLPFGSTVLENGQLGHGWMTQLLPFCEQQSVYEKIDMTKAWNDPQNAPVFREQFKRNDVFVSPYFKRLPQEEQFDRNGFAKTDYSANQFVLPVGRSLKTDEIADGLSNTVLFGEVTQNLPAWGSPLNGRDLRLGINSSPYGFGSKHLGGANFAHCDDSVHFHSEKTDPKILEALTNPADGQ
jgi:prepilin-type N-terminal cleavage/methylation domain-containing protein